MDNGQALEAMLLGRVSVVLGCAILLLYIGFTCYICGTCCIYGVHVIYVVHVVYMMLCACCICGAM